MNKICGGGFQPPTGGKDASATIITATEGDATEERAEQELGPYTKERTQQAASLQVIAIPLPDPAARCHYPA
jgi:hypothetical protein